jgi:hypothetical protein
VYQLALQFAPWNDRSFDELVDLEDRLELFLTSDEIDGHDLGSNEANIFIHTEHPATALKACIPVITAAGLLAKFSAGCRSLDQDEYARVWPVGDVAPFIVR